MLSIIIPVYNEEGNIKELFSRIEDVLNRMQKTYEVIFVDDGSTDKTFEILKELSEKNKQLKAIRFRRNFGKSAALTAGFESALGEFVITMDGDLQNDPEEIPNFLEKIKDSYDLVVGWQAEKYKKMIRKKIASQIFNGLTIWLTGAKVRDSNCCFKAFKNEVVKNIKLHGELHRYIPALVHWQGYKIAEIKVGYRPRMHGKSKYGFARLIKGFLDLITVKFLMAYLNKPIHFFGQIGLLSLFFGFLSGIAAVVLKFQGTNFSRTPLPLFTVFLVIVGIQFILMGLLAEILIRIYYEPRGKTSYSIKEKINL